MFEYCSFGEASDCTEVDLADRYKSAHLCGEDCPPTSNGELSNEPIESDIDGGKFDKHINHIPLICEDFLTQFTMVLNCHYPCR